jgi:hypothetical protein
VEESRTSEADVTLVDKVGVTNAPVPELVGRTAYRIAQEGLTNARKHAPGADAVVAVTGRPGEGLAIEVRNPLPTEDRAHGRRQSAIPGAGQGLIGLSERAALVGGRLEHGSTPSADFRLYAWLPWPPPPTPRSAQRTAQEPPSTKRTRRRIATCPAASYSGHMREPRDRPLESRVRVLLVDDDPLVRAG